MRLTFLILAVGIIVAFSLDFVLGDGVLGLQLLWVLRHLVLEFLDQILEHAVLVDRDAEGHDVLGDHARFLIELFLNVAFDVRSINLLKQIS